MSKNCKQLIYILLGQYTIIDYKLEAVGETPITWNNSISHCLFYVKSIIT